MNIIKKVILFMRNLFTKQEKVKELTEPKAAINQNKKENFIEGLKISTPEKNVGKKIETLTCDGDGLGIQKKMNF